ncbi:MULTISPECIES: hypothetical protein [unclassified Streptomyces]|jgi:hypothetical protein|uniref:hypothetical protein n=1 Tax=unclassified Streptomyces TaxID=2593676 RepID=UPI00034E0F31|nr:hypothetical protein [Streptomyces sp. HGB0020]EPD54785.1 hypothetical protein HMPREF1211_08319 [Streptomyces sp. HGB0020]
MPRPTPAQLVYGSCTVIFSTLAMLLLSQTSSGVGIAVIAVSALALGLLVAMTVPLPRPRVVAVEQPARNEAPVPAAVASRASEPVRERAAS